MAEPPREPGAPRWMAVLLDGVGGYVDAVGYLLLFHLFAANMSGNSILLGVALGQSQWPTALRQALPIPLFVVGAALGVAVGLALARRGVRRRVAALLALEVVLLAAFALYGSRFLHDGALRLEADWQGIVLAALLTLPMGIQNIALRRVGGLSVRTTFVTGTLMSLAEALVGSLGRAPRGPAEHGGPAASRPGGSALLLGGMWAAYVAGAGLGAALVLSWALGALVVPLLVLGGLIVVELRRPIAPPAASGDA
jgi:uncharacterized membrane protein YoaK (UPF0700 family)